MGNDPSNLAGLDASALRRLFVDNVLLYERVSHVGRLNRLMGHRRDIAESLATAGAGSEREILPLLDHANDKVRLAAIYAIKPLNRSLFQTLLGRRLADDPGRPGREAHFDREILKLLEEIEQRRPEPAPAAPPNPQWMRILAWQANNPPPKSLSRDQFEGRVLTEFSADRARQILELARPAIGLWPQRRAAPDLPSASRHCGALWAPPDWRWPIYEEEPMYFLGQIHCPDLAGLPGAELLPHEGVLAFFGDFDAIAGCEPAGSVEQGAVYHWPEAGLVPTKPPLPLDDHPEEQVATPLAFRPFIDLPDPFSAIIDELALSEAEEEAYRSLRHALRASGIPDDVVDHCDLDSKLLGWPDLVQGDFFLPQVGPNAYRQLAQLPARLGPGGSLYFFIRGEDLARRSFAGCVLEEQNT
jgi:hypothetical protein